MRKAIIGLVLVLSLTLPASAAEIEAPLVPKSGIERMPENTDSFGDALLELVQNSMNLLRPDLKEAAEATMMTVAAGTLFSIIQNITKKISRTLSAAGAITIAVIMFRHSNSMIVLASDTVIEIYEYGKLLCQVMTAALAAQGCVTESSALYVGTTFFITLLSTLVSKLVVPMAYIFLAFSVGYCAMNNEILKKIADAIKGVLGWALKTLLVVFTAYMSITGVVSGTTDAASLKAAKVVISTVVPVVGGALADSSESVLISMGLVKNAAGIYGILAVLAVFAGPFLKIGAHYLFLKVSATICASFGDKSVSGLTGDFSSAMGLLMAMIASGCVMVLISTVCFLKGAC